MPSLPHVLLPQHLSFPLVAAAHVCTLAAATSTNPGPLGPAPSPPSSRGSNQSRPHPASTISAGIERHIQPSYAGWTRCSRIMPSMVFATSRSRLATRALDRDVCPLAWATIVDSSHQLSLRKHCEKAVVR